MSIAQISRDALCFTSKAVISRIAKALHSVYLASAACILHSSADTQPGYSQGDASPGIASVANLRLQCSCIMLHGATAHQLSAAPSPMLHNASLSCCYIK